MRTSILIALLVVASGTVAQALPRLHVQSFVLSTDTATPQQEQPFHVIIDVRLGERVDNLDAVVLPLLDGLEILGDEKHMIATAGGSVYHESLAVVAHRTGPLTIDPAYLDAIDARDGKAKRFVSNALTLHVGGAVAAARDLGNGAISYVMEFISLAAGAIIVIALALFALRMRHEPVRVPQPELEPTPAAALAPPDPRDAITQARAILASDHSHAGALAARSVLWRFIGASDGETLADIVRRPSAHDPALRSVLRALERAAFTDDADRDAACNEALQALDGYRA